MKAPTCADPARIGRLSRVRIAPEMIGVVKSAIEAIGLFQFGKQQTKRRVSSTLLNKA